MTRISMQFHIELKYAYLEEGKYRSGFLEEKKYILYPEWEISRISSMI